MPTEGRLLDYQVLKGVFGEDFFVEDRGDDLKMWRGARRTLQKMKGWLITPEEAYYMRACKPPIVPDFTSPSGVEALIKKLRERLGLKLERQRTSKYRKRWKIGQFESNDPREVALVAIARPGLRRD